MGHSMAVVFIQEQPALERSKRHSSLVCAYRFQFICALRPTDVLNKSRLRIHSRVEDLRAGYHLPCHLYNGKEGLLCVPIIEYVPGLADSGATSGSSWSSAVAEVLAGVSTLLSRCLRVIPDRVNTSTGLYIYFIFV